jgi:hypothetical protein
MFIDMSRIFQAWAPASHLELSPHGDLYVALAKLGRRRRQRRSMIQTLERQIISDGGDNSARTLLNEFR